MTARLDAVENRAGTLDTADQSAEAPMERMRQIDRQALDRKPPGRRAADAAGPGSATPKCSPPGHPGYAKSVKKSGASLFSAAGRSGLTPVR